MVGVFIMAFYSSSRSPPSSGRRGIDDKFLKVDHHAIYGEEACGLLEEEN
jgi:hypothetical protein